MLSSKVRFTYLSFIYRYLNLVPNIEFLVKKFMLYSLIPVSPMSLLKSCTFLVMTWMALTPAAGQQIYEPGQVDKPAAPAGGRLSLVEFITHNIRPPFSNRVNNVEGKVEIKGVIEPDGSASSLEIVSGLNPESDEEVLRIFRLFRGWKPAEKEGGPVRQSFKYALQFKPERLENFNPDTYGYEFYFDRNFKKLTDGGEIAYRVSVPVDKNGIPKPGLRIGEKNKGKWAEIRNTENVSAPVPKGLLSLLLGVGENELDRYVGGAEAYVVKGDSEPFDTGLPEYIVTSDGKIVRELLPGVFSKVYYASGQTARVTIPGNGGIVQTLSWYPNSVTKEKYYSQQVNDSTVVDKIVLVSDSLGNAMVEGGNGRITGYDHHWGEGEVVNGFQTGVWKSANSEGVLFEEVYEEGRFVRGTKYTVGEETYYTRLETQPAFKGGDTAFYRFLGQNIRYPSEAAKDRIKGKVVLSFIVEPNGDVRDIEVIKRVAPALDEEAVRIIRLTSGNWIPGTFRALPVRAKYTVPVNFALQ